MISQRIALRVLLSIASLLTACAPGSSPSPAEKPTSATTATSPAGESPTPLPTATPPLVAEFSDLTLVPGRLAGDWSVVGLITNGSDRAVRGVQLDVSLFDAADALLALQTVTPALTILAARGTSPFSARFTSVGEADHVRVEVISYVSSNEPSATVAVEALEARPTGDGRMAAYGVVVNDGRQTVEIVNLALMAISPSGEPMALSGEAEGLSVLHPGASAPFVAVVDTGDRSISLRAFSVAQPISSPSEPAIALSGPVQIQAAGDGSPLVIATLHNDGHDWFTADVVVELHLGDQLVGLGELELPWPLAPGESRPFMMSEFPGALERIRSLGTDPRNLLARLEIDPAGSRRSDSPPVMLEADITAQNVIQGSLFLKGTLTNDTSEQIDRPSAVIAIHSTQGEVIAAGFVVAGPEIAAGQSLPFILTLRLPVDTDLAMAEFDLRAGGFHHP
jgi:hypothetical protein